MAIRATVNFAPLDLELREFELLSAYDSTYEKLVAEASYQKPTVADLIANYYPTHQKFRDIGLVSEAHILVINKTINDSIVFSDTATFKDQYPEGGTSISDYSSHAFNKNISERVTLGSIFTHASKGGHSDTAGVADKISTHLSRNVFDHITMSDRIKAGNRLFEVIEEPTYLTDIMSLALSDILPDSYSIFDAASLVLAKQLAENSIATDKISTHLSKTISDSIQLTDGEAIRFNSVNTEYVNILLAQTLLSDGLNIDSSKMASSNIGFTQELITLFSRPTTDNSSITDISVREVSKRIEDSIVLTETASSAVRDSTLFNNSMRLVEQRKKYLAKPLTEISNLLDTVAKGTAANKQDTFNTSDVTALHTLKNIDDWINVVGSTVVVEHDNTFTTSSLGFLELLRNSITKYIADSSDISDIVTLANTKKASDSIGFSDTHVSNISKNISEILFLSDSEAHPLYIPKSYSEPASIQDYAIREFSKLSTDSLALSQNLIKILGKQVTPDLLQITEIVKRLLAKNIEDTTALMETVISEVTKIRRDEISFTERFTREFKKHLVDTIRLVGSQQIVEYDNSIYVNNLLISEIISSAFSKTSDSTVAFSEEVDVFNTKIVRDSTSFSDETNFDFLKRYIDPVLFNELLSIDSVKTLNTDTSILLDTVTTLLSKLFTDNTTLSDNTTVHPHKFTQDGTLYTDVANLQFNKNNEDSLHFSENLSLQWIRASADTTNITDQISKNTQRTYPDALAISETIHIDMGSSVFNTSTFNSTTLG